MQNHRQRLEQDGSVIDSDQFRGLDYLAILYEQWRVLLGTICVFLVLAIVARYVLPDAYEGAVVMVPAADPSSASTPVLGTLMNLGLMGASADGDKKAVALATLQSRSFIESFIESENLLPVLFSDEWNSQTKTWKTSHAPTLEDGYDTLHGAMTVDAPATDDIVTLRVRWRDAATASWMANHLISKLNALFQAKAVADADRMIAYLNDAYQRTTVAELRTSVANLMEEQLKLRIMAKSRDEYSLTVVDPAAPSKKRVSPGLAVLLSAGMFLGILFGVPAAFLWHSLEPRWSNPFARIFRSDGERWRISLSR